MTGEWEQKLRRIEEGKMSRNSFMEEISHLTREFVEKTTGFDETTASLKKTYLLSPSDKQPLLKVLINIKMSPVILKYPKILPVAVLLWMR